MSALHAVVLLLLCVCLLPVITAQNSTAPPLDDYSPVQMEFVAPYLVELAEVCVTYTLFKILTDQDSDAKDHRIKIRALNIGTAAGTLLGLLVSAAIGLAVKFSGLEVNDDLVEGLSAVSKALTILFMLKLLWKVTRLVQGNPNNSVLLRVVQPLIDKLRDDWALGLIMFLTALRDVLELGVLNIIPQMLSDMPDAVFPSMAVGIASFLAIALVLFGINWLFNRLSPKRGQEAINPKAVVVISLGITALGAFMSQDLGAIIGEISGADETILQAVFGLLLGLIFFGRTLWYCWFKFARPRPEGAMELRNDSEVGDLDESEVME